MGKMRQERNTIRLLWDCVSLIWDPLVSTQARQQDSDNGFPSQENFRRCQSLFRCTNEMMKSTRNTRKQILASQASVPANTMNPSAPATSAISRKTSA